MVRYRFHTDFDYVVRFEGSGLMKATVAYLAGDYEDISEEHAAAADAAGVGERIDASKPAIREPSK